MIAQTLRKSPEIATGGSKPVARQVNLTKRAIDALRIPEGTQRAYYHDSQVRGLCIAVSPAGRKVFVWYAKVAGRPERVTLGVYPDMSIEEARGAAHEKNAQRARGENPADERRNLRAEATLEELFNAYGADVGEGLRSWDNLKSMFHCHLEGLRLRKMSAITKADVLRLHRRIVKTDPQTGRTKGTYAANRVIELLSALFNWAREHSEWKGENPAAGIEPFKERKRERFLDGAELPAFFKALAAESNETIRDYVLVSLLTGARRSNVQAMEWKELNWARNEWKIPPEKAKSDEPITVAFTPVVVQILGKRQSSSMSEWVFPGKGRTGHLVEPKTAWKRILARARDIEMRDWLKANKGKTPGDFLKYKPVPSFSDLRLHDLRRTLGSWQAATGASLPVIGKSLGHSSLQATQIYARLDLDPVRAAVARATDAMLVAGNVKGLLGGEQ